MKAFMAALLLSMDDGSAVAITIFSLRQMLQRRVPRFEIALREAEVVACWLCSCSDSRLVHNALGLAVPFKWALLFVPAAASTDVGIWVWF